jgi:hypothetical protein
MEENLQLHDAPQNSFIHIFCGIFRGIEYYYVISILEKLVSELAVNTKKNK